VIVPLKVTFLSQLIERLKSQIPNRPGKGSQPIKIENQNKKIYILNFCLPLIYSAGQMPHPVMVSVVHSSDFCIF